MKHTLQILLIIFIYSCTPQLTIEDYPPQSESYPMFGRIPERSFYYHVNLTDSLELKWEETAKGSFSNNSVVIEDNYVFTSDLAANIYCYNADTSKIIGADKGSGEIAVAPLLNSGFIYYIITVDDEPYSELISYNIRKGERNREREIPGRVGNEMLLLENSLFFVSDDGVAYKYDFYFQKQWEVDLKENVYSSPASTKNKIFVATHDGEIVCLDTKDGKIIYTNKLSDEFESAIVINNNHGFIGDTKGDIVAFDIQKGKEIWRGKTGAKIKAPAVHNGTYIYAANLAGSLNCFDITTGDEIWHSDTDGIFNTPAALFNNILVQPDLNQRLLFFDPKSGNLIKTMEFEARVKLHPVYFNDMLYVGIDRGILLAYKCVSEFE